MNKIEGLLDKSDYEVYWDYLNYRIDDYWLDEKLHELYPNNFFKGLIPTLVYWMERDDEKDVVWKRILPEKGETSLCPILMCPDDNDFSCTLIVAEIYNSKDVITWRRMGINLTNEWEVEKVGSKVEWLDKVTELIFDKHEYLVMLNHFKERHVFEKARVDNLNE